MPGAQPRRPPGERPPPERARFTSRAAVLAVVVCAIALSLAYPVREYIAQRRQIDQLQAQSAATTAELARLRAEAQRLNNPAYIEQQAEDRLHMCLPGGSCYVIIGGQAGRWQLHLECGRGHALVRAAVALGPPGGPG